MVNPIILNLNQIQNHIMENIFLLHAYMNSRSKENPIEPRLLKSTPENHALAPTNLTIWVITSLVMGLCPYQRKLRPFNPSQFQKLANNCVSLSV